MRDDRDVETLLFLLVPALLIVAAAYLGRRPDSAARAALREALERGVIDENAYAAHLRAIEDART